MYVNSFDMSLVFIDDLYFNQGNLSIPEKSLNQYIIEAEKKHETAESIHIASIRLVHASCIFKGKCITRSV